MRLKHPKPASNLNRGSTVVAPIRDSRSSLAAFRGTRIRGMRKRGEGGGKAVTLVANRRTRTRQCVNRVRLMENGMACPVGMPARPQKPFRRTTMLAKLLRYACMPGLVSFRCAQQYTRHRKTLRKNHSPRKVAE